MEIALALVITVVSACCLNLGYLMEHQAAAQLPPLTPRHPIRSARLLLRNRRWLAGFAAEAIGWGLYVVALALAPLSLVQAAAAGGIGILALMVSRVTHAPLRRVEWVGVGISILGLAALGASLAGGHVEGTKGSVPWIVVWLFCSLIAAAVAAALLPPLVGHGGAWGIAAGTLFAAGDVATKAAVDGGQAWPAFGACLIAAYALGTLALQAGFQRSSALTTAGLATLLTNALPIAAGMIVFHELGLSGWSGALRVGAFVLVIVGAVILAARTRASEQLAAEARRVDDEPDTTVGFA